MNYELASRAQRDLGQYLYHIMATDLLAASRERFRIHEELERLATSTLTGAQTRIRGWPRVILRHYLHPFHVYYERRPTGLFVARLYHYARRPIQLL
jgi:plasmid stabilization system protein ParE